MRTSRRFDFSILIFALLCSINATALAQSNPTPFDLSTGNFTMASWPAASSSGTYPSNMIFHRCGTQDPGLSTDMTTDYAGSYNSTSGSRINGLDANGVSFLNLGTSGNLGAATTSLNVSGRANVKVTFTCQLLAQGDGAPVPREYAIRLQYRIGTNGTWTDVPGPVEYSSAGKAVNHTQTIGPADIPSEINNQAVAQLRWKYYSAAANSGGTRPQIRLDDIYISSVSTLGVPANFIVGSISPASPSATSYFNAVVQSVDAGGNLASVSQNTTFSLYVAAGSGTLGGTITGTILAGNTSVNIAGITYNAAEANVRIAAARTSGDMLAAGISAPFTVGIGATSLAFTGLQVAANAGKILKQFTVEARRPNGSLDPSYQGGVTISIASGNATLNGTKTRPFVNGVAVFNDLSISNAGNYALSASSAGLSQATSPVIAVSPPITMTPISVPQYIKSATNDARMPSFALMSFDNLLPNTQYRYYTSICSSVSEAGAGDGNNIHYSDETGAFSVSSQKSLTSTNIPPDYSSFTTGSTQTSKTIWVNIVTANNARFIEGANAYWRIIMTDAPNYPCDTLTSSIPSKTLEFGQFSNNCTGIYDSVSGMQPKNYVLIYDNVNGTGNPITSAIVENIGATLRLSPSIGPASYFERLESVGGSWATLIPNNLYSGIRRIEERGANGSLVRYWTDDDGAWAGVNTVNPFSGQYPAINFKTPQITLVSSPAAGSTLCANGSGVISWASRGVQSARIELYKGMESPLTIASDINAFAQTYQWTVSGVTDSSKSYQIRIVDSEHGTTFASSGLFSIFLPPIIIQEPASINTCSGDNIRLIIQARGTSMKYQWQKDGVDIPGAKDTTLFLNNAATSTSGLYRCLVTGLAPCSQAASRTATVFVTPPIQILKQPTYKKAAIGSFVEISVEVMGTENHSYQWRRGTQNLQNNSRISGAHSPTLTIHSYQDADAGSNYNCVITGKLPCGTVISQSGGFVTSSVQFRVQPDSAHGCAGSGVIFSSSAVSNPPFGALAYNWLHDGKPISNGNKYQGVATPNLIVLNLSAADSGLYWVEVSGPGNATVTSRRALLTVGSKARVIEQPQSARLCPGATILLRVSASNAENTTYKWLINGAVVSGAIADSVLATAPNSSDSVYQYRCIATTSCGADTSAIATLSAFDKPTITDQPEKETSVKVGDGIYLFIRYITNYTAKFQWYKGNSPVFGAEKPELRIVDAQLADSGSYRCAVIGVCDTVYSDFTTVKIYLPSGVTDSENMCYYDIGSAPNPAIDNTTIFFGVDRESEASVKILETTGREVKSVELGVLSIGKHAATLDLSDLAAGIYFCRIEAGGTTRILRVSIVR